MRVYKEGKPFWDPAGDRLRDWMGIDKTLFYNRDLVSILPIAFCFPGYNASGSDLPPPPICWKTWHEEVLDLMGEPGLRLLIGKYAIERHLGVKGKLTEIVQNWRAYAPETFVLPHPSWRNNAWLAQNTWFENDLLPELRQAVDAQLHA